MTTQNDVPTVSVGSYSIDAHDLDNCIELTGPQSGQLCQTLRFTPSRRRGDYWHPQRRCHQPKYGSMLFGRDPTHRVVRTPGNISLNTDIECIDQSDQEMTLTVKIFYFSGWNSSNDCDGRCGSFIQKVIVLN